MDYFPEKVFIGNQICWRKYVPIQLSKYSVFEISHSVAVNHYGSFDVFEYSICCLIFVKSN